MTTGYGSDNVTDLIIIQFILIFMWSLSFFCGGFKYQGKVKRQRWSKIQALRLFLLSQLQGKTESASDTEGFRLKRQAVESAS